jgi:hypothetical protein
MSLQCFKSSLKLMGSLNFMMQIAKGNEHLSTSATFEVDSTTGWIISESANQHCPMLHKAKFNSKIKFKTVNGTIQSMFSMATYCGLFFIEYYMWVQYSGSFHNYTNIESK